MKPSHRHRLLHCTPVRVVLVLTLIAWSGGEVAAQVLTGGRPPTPPPPPEARSASAPRSPRSAVTSQSSPVRPPDAGSRLADPTLGTGRGFVDPMVTSGPQERPGHAPLRNFGRVAARGRSEFAEHEARAADAARAYRELAGEGDSPQRDELRARVRAEISAAFDARQKEQRRSLEALRARLEQVERTIAAREATRERIVEHRVEVLLDPALAWDDGGGGVIPQAAAGPGGIGPRRKPRPPVPDVAPGTPDPSRSGASALAGPGRDLTLPGLPAGVGVPRGRTNSAPLRDVPASTEDLLTTLEDLYGEYRRLGTGGGDVIGRLASGDREAQASRLKAFRADLETRRKLVELDLRKAELGFDRAAADLQDAKRRVEAGQETEADYRSKQADVELARIEIERVRTILKRYIELADELVEWEKKLQEADETKAEPAAETRAEARN